MAPTPRGRRRRLFNARASRIAAVRCFVLLAAVVWTFAASDAVLAANAPFSTLASDADEIHWTVTGPTSVTVSWRGTSDVVRYGATSGYGHLARGKAPVPYPVSSPGPFWEARITGLHANAIYHYAVNGGADHVFRTPPLPGTAEFTVGAEADIGDAGFYSRVAPVQSLIAGFAPSFVLTPGDLTYANDHGQPSVDRHFNDVMVWSQDAAYMPTWGNHEWERDTLANYKGRFDLPNPRTAPGAPDAGGEDWWWVDYGNTRFIGYPEPYSGAWADWNAKAKVLMDSAQANPSIRFIVTAGHRPAYSSGHHSGSPSLSGYLGGLGATHSKYVLNLNGHSHDYERSFPQSGVTHVTVGTGGSSLESDPNGNCQWAGGCPPPAWSAYRAYHHGALRLQFTPTGIVGDFVCGPSATTNDVSCASGEVIDHFVIGTANHAPSIVAPAVVTVARGQRLDLPVSATDPEGDPITLLAADLSELPAGNDAHLTLTGPAAGHLTWQTTLADGPRIHYVTLKAADAQLVAVTLAIQVTGPDTPPSVSVAPAVNAWEGQPVFVSVTASDPDGDDLESLVADLSGLPAGGSGATFAVSPSRTSGTLIWTPGYDDAGHTYPVRFTAANALTGADTVLITVFDVDRAPTVSAPPSVIASPGVELSLSIGASDADGDAISSLTADLSKLPAGHGATFTAGAGNTSGTFRWMPATDTPESTYVVRFTATNARTGLGTTGIRVTRSNHAPQPDLIVTPPSGVEPQAVTADATRSADAEGDPLTYTFAFGDGATAGPQTSPKAMHTYAAGVWIAKVTVSDGSSAVESAPVMVSVAQNLITNPSFEHNTNGWNAYTGSTLGIVPGGQEGDSALAVNGPNTTAAFGLNDSPNWVGNTTAQTHYRYAAWIRTNGRASSIKLRVREYSGGVQVGASTNSPSITGTGAWQRLEAEHVANTSGSTLDFQVVDTPVSPLESFLVDDLSIRIVSTGGTTAAPGGSPAAFALSLAPNPLHGPGEVAFAITRSGPVSVGLYDVQGRLVHTIVDGVELAPGRYRLPLAEAERSGRPLGAGIYFCRLTAAEGVRMVRVAIVR